MLVFKSLDTQLNTPCVVALGCFDGVHMGHATVIGEAKKRANELGLPLAIFTFEQPPRNFFERGSVPLICATEEKLSLLERIGVQIAVCVPLSREIFSMPADVFVSDMLLKRMNAQHIVCGYDYSFGKNAQGDPTLISDMCKNSGVGVSVVPAKMINGIPVSSSIIRKYVLDGDMKATAELLGRPFSLFGEVIGGQHLARTLGFPTVNIVPKQDLLTPKNGVYVTEVIFEGAKKYGITNVGVRPTVNTKILCAETHIFDFDGDLYGKEITVRFLHFIREEKKFTDVEAMAHQIKADIQTARRYISANSRN